VSNRGLKSSKTYIKGSQWLRRLRHGAAAAGIAGSVSAGGMEVSVVCCICDGSIARLEESYRVCACMCVIECSQVQQ